MPFFETNDQTRLYYKEWGTGKPAVFVSSWALSSEMWEYQMLPLSSQGVRCIAYDRRGHGRSDDPGRGYEFDTLADDLAALIEQLDLHEVTLIAHSMGCAEVVHYLARHGASRIARITLVSPIRLIKADDNPALDTEAVFEMVSAELVADRPRFFTHGTHKFFSLGAQWPLAAQVSPEMVDWGIRLILQASPKATLECWRAMWCANLEEEVRSLTVPTLVIHGDNDLTAPLETCGQRIAQAVTNSELKVYPGAPHGLPLTHHVQLAADLFAFIHTA
jgi:non-heme chloroperoxidase